MHLKQPVFLWITLSLIVFAAVIHSFRMCPKKILKILPCSAYTRAAPVNSAHAIRTAGAARIETIKQKESITMAEQHRAGRIRRTRTNPSQYHPKHMRVGAWGERTACAILTSLGYRIIERNWRPSPEANPERIRGEIDAIAISPEDELVIIEVKTRSSLDFGHPLAAFDRDKGKRTRRLAFMWAGQQEHLDFGLMRVDAVAVTGTEEHFTFEHAKAVA